jgi:hypothetical protein
VSNSRQRRLAGTRPIRCGWVSLVASIVLAPIVGHGQPDSGALLREGNSLFRSGNYSAAIRTYEAAREDGQSSALLDYNLGVAYYKNGNYAAARGALQRAAIDSDIAPLAHYNLGLTSRAYGDYVDARRWFERVVAGSPNARLVSLADRGIAEAITASAAPAQTTQASDERFQPFRPGREPAGDLQLMLGVRAGQNGNVYRSPGEAYVDLGQAGQPVIAPAVQAATYYPVDVLALYALNSEGSDTQFRFLYRLDGEFYDSQYSNANEITQRFEMGADIDLEGRHERRLRPAVYFSHHEETNFDPDSGIDREIGGEDISDRLSYGSAGLKSAYEHEFEKWSFGFDARVERRRYQDVPVLPSYDHELYNVRMWTQYQLLRNTGLEFGLRSMGRRYDSRLSRNLNGDLLGTNETLRYVYSGADIGVEHRMGKDLRLEANFSRLEREDRFLGYADYTQDAARLTVRYRFSQRARLAASAVTRQYDYPRAFAFNEPAAGALELESSSLELELDYRFRRNLSLWIELEIRDVTSTDSRIAFERTRSMLGVKWRR